MPSKKLTVLSGNRITLPAKFVGKWEIKEDDMVLAEWNDEAVLTVTAMELTPKELQK